MIATLNPPSSEAHRGRMYKAPFRIILNEHADSIGSAAGRTHDPAGVQPTAADAQSSSKSNNCGGGREKAECFGKDIL